MMNITVKKAFTDDKEIIRNLVQFYQYDFTDFGGEHLGQDAKFHYKHLDSYWKEGDRHPFLIFADEEIAGFSFVNGHSLLGNEDVHSIAEFFILRYFRGLGIGLDAAAKIVSFFPGKWEVSQTYQNKGAQKFWMKFMKATVNDKFERIDLEKEKKIVLKFKV